jgi:hypothetical protein
LRPFSRDRIGILVDDTHVTEDSTMAWQHIGRKGAAAAAVAGLGALLVGCGANNLPNTQAQSFGAAGAPVSVACEPNQRAIVRQVLVNGVAQAQAECQSVGMVGTSGTFAPVAYGTPAAVPVNYGYTQAPIPETRLVQTAYTQPVATRQAAPQRVAYQRAPERRVVAEHPKRSVKKSAIIIGSSAGVGAGIGAAVGGKKGAGIGALIGGGGAALWDQITRRQ